MFVLFYRYPWRIFRDTVWISLSDFPCLYGYPYRYPWKTLDIHEDIHTNTGASTIRPGNFGVFILYLSRSYIAELREARHRILFQECNPSLVTKPCATYVGGGNFRQEVPSGLAAAKRSDSEVRPRASNLRGGMSYPYLGLIQDKIQK